MKFYIPKIAENERSVLWPTFWNICISRLTASHTKAVTCLLHLVRYPACSRRLINAQSDEWSQRPDRKTSNLALSRTGRFRKTEELSHKLIRKHYGSLGIWAKAWTDTHKRWPRVNIKQSLNKASGLLWPSNRRKALTEGNAAKAERPALSAPTRGLHGVHSCWEAACKTNLEHLQTFQCLAQLLHFYELS